MEDLDKYTPPKKTESAILARAAHHRKFSGSAVSAEIQPDSIIQPSKETSVKERELETKIDIVRDAIAYAKQAGYEQVTVETDVLEALLQKYNS